MDIEDRKILNRRKKRVDQIEDCPYDIDLFFRKNKRFKPSSNESTFDSD